ncbi:MAG: NRDE family protein [Syntrophomonadaceae bacterium]|jgi:uncharacterized protein with NRDE domain|nr:NRDE family protein [Syntrophomonadaceae bacterium]
MCIVLWASDCHDKYKLVVAANRDEFYQRPTLPAEFWPENPAILAGKDMKHGGTWMGITLAGGFATLTNFRDPANYNPNAPSRGHLVQEYLESTADAQSYMQKILAAGLDFNGFNLLAGTVDELYYLSNQERIIRPVAKGYHGLSNSLLDVPWPKVTRGLRNLAACLQKSHIEVEDLFEMMADRHQPPDQQLPQTGVSLEMERLLAPAFVEMQDYGTRTTTVILVDRNNLVQFRERSFVPPLQGNWTEVRYQFQLEADI